MYLKRYLYHDVLGKFRNAPYQLTNRSAITLGSGKEVRGGFGKETLRLSTEVMLWKLRQGYPGASWGLVPMSH